MAKNDNIVVPRWFLEVVEDTLRIQNNINLDKKTGETCQDRNVRQSLNGMRKLLNGEELTGGERFERLHHSLPSNLDEAAEKYSENILANNEDLQDAIEDAFKEGAEWMAGQGETKQGVVTKDDFIRFADNTYIDLDPKLELTPAFSLKDAKEVVVQVRKK